MQASHIKQHVPAFAYQRSGFLRAMSDAGLKPTVVHHNLTPAELYEQVRLKLQCTSQPGAGRFNPTGCLREGRAEHVRDAAALGSVSGSFKGNVHQESAGSAHVPISNPIKEHMRHSQRYVAIRPIQARTPVRASAQAQEHTAPWVLAEGNGAGMLADAVHVVAGLAVRERYAHCFERSSPDSVRYSLSATLPSPILLLAVRPSPPAAPVQSPLIQRSAFLVCAASGSPQPFV